MANIKVKDLTSIARLDLFGNSESFIRDISKCELALQGGRKGAPFAPPVPTPIDPPVDPGFDPGIPPFLPGFYI
jgi:hypothetical protein